MQEVFQKGVDNPHEFRKTAKSEWVSIKRRKSATAALREFVKSVGAKRYHAVYADNMFARDDVVCVYYECPIKDAMNKLVAEWEAKGKTREELLEELETWLAGQPPLIESLDKRDQEDES